MGKRRFVPAFAHLDTRIMPQGAGFDPPAPLNPDEMRLPPLDMPTTTGDSSADGFPDSTLGTTAFTPEYDSTNSVWASF